MSSITTGVAAYDPGARDFVRAQQLDVTRLATDNGVALAIGASPNPSAVFAANTRSVRLVATVDCWVEVGLNATAATTSFYLPANTVEYFAAQPGWRVSVLQNLAAGTLYARTVN